MGLADIVVKVAAALGANESKMRWRMHQLRRWWDKSARKVEQKSEKVRYAHKKCGACRALNDAADKTCSSCGEPLGWRLTQMFQRAGVGGVATTSSVIVALALVIHLVALLSLGGSFEVRYGWLEMRATMAFEGAGWQIVGLPYVHLSLLGLLATVFAIYLLGQEIEALYGRFAMPAWFMATAMVGALVHGALFDSILFGGAAGLCGLIGVGLAAGHRAANHAGRELRNLMFKWALCVLGILLLLQGNIVGPLASLATGALIGTVAQPTSIRRSRLAQITLGSLSLAALTAAALAAVPALSTAHLWSGV